MFTLTIDTGNAAFADGELPFELVRLLRSLADDLAYGGPLSEDGGPLHDVNGNHVGRWSYVPAGTETDYPEGTLAVCRHCERRILLDQREGGGAGKDWGSAPADWSGNGGTGMDYGCGANPESDEEGTAGHAPDLDTIRVP